MVFSCHFREKAWAWNSFEVQLLDRVADNATFVCIEMRMTHVQPSILLLKDLFAGLTCFSLSLPSVPILLLIAAETSISPERFQKDHFNSWCDSMFSFFLQAHHLLPSI